MSFWVIYFMCDDYHVRSSASDVCHVYIMDFSEFFVSLMEGREYALERSEFVLVVRQ